MLRSLLIVAATAMALGGCRASREAADISALFPAAPQGEPAHAAAEESASWQSAVAPRAFAFPQDHGPHPDYRIEWWYYTGNLRSADGRRFGYQLTFFRAGVQHEPRNPSRWAIRDLYVAHFAIADLQRREHRPFQRTSRGSLGAAGAEANAARIWNGNWQACLSGDQHRLEASAADCAIDLTLRAEKPLVLHGERGLSRKGAAAGNASYYYSFSRLQTRGTVTVRGEAVSVEGDSWMDHEFSSSFLERGQRGWDWFAIQLDNGDDLMLYQIRGEGGSSHPSSSGTLVLPSGESVPLSGAEILLRATETWKSPATGAAYPLAWRLEIPRLAYRLELRAAFPEQEMDTRDSTGVVYWEGSIRASGTAADQPVAGQGYLELTGYVASAGAAQAAD